MPETAKKLGTVGLAAVVISSMLGGGIFSLPQNMAEHASLCAILLAWLITGIGMWGIANSFRILSTVRPDLNAGIYIYAAEGFGPFAGFLIAWAYWLCQICGNIGYAVLTMDALNYFFPPYFQGGNTFYAIAGGSCIIWFFNFVVLRGAKQASVANIIGTAGTIVPLLVFIAVMAFVWNVNKFDFDFFGNMVIQGKTLGSMDTQIKSTMLVTLWSFIGIEGAVMLSGRARSARDVGQATVIGFLGALCVYVLLSVLPFGFMTQREIASVADPSTAGILKAVVGPWGAWFMNLGMLTAILTSWLAWTMITAEMPFAAAQNGTFPRIFSKENSHGSPNISLWTTSLIMQLGMFLVYFSHNAWHTMLNITSVMVLPAYAVSMMYLWKICEDGEYPANYGIQRSVALSSSILAIVYSLWLVYAAGLAYMLVATIFVTCGIPVYMWACKENGRHMFIGYEKVLLAILLILTVAAIFLIYRGKLAL